MPATMSVNARPWYQRGTSPSSAADIKAAKTGVRLEKNAASAGPPAAIPNPDPAHQRA